MEKITVFLLLFICFFLIYSYLKFKKDISKKEKKEDIIYSGVKKEDIFEKHALAAIIAAVMDEKKYKIKNIFLEKKEPKKSTWKTSGREYNMQRRERI